MAKIISGMIPIGLMKNTLQKLLGFQQNPFFLIK